MRIITRRLHLIKSILVLVVASFTKGIGFIDELATEKNN